MAPGLAAAPPLTETVRGFSGQTRLYVHRDSHVWTWAAAVAIAADLRRDLQLRERTRLIVSADAMAMPVYDALARAPLPWDHVDVGLTDERWLHPDDPDSHAAAIRRGLLHHHAADARFEALTGAGRRIEDALATANAHAQQPAHVAVLTLGDDGRLAGLFPSSPDCPRALESQQSYAALDASMHPGEEPWARRISVTPIGLSRVHSRLLLIRGRVQRRLVEEAVENAGVARSPALSALRDRGATLDVHWAP